MSAAYQPRILEPRLRRFVQRFPVVVLGGARQTGKSTLLAHCLAGEFRFFVFDPVQDIAGARHDPELFLRLNPTPLVLDEVQYAPELLPPFKRIVDETPGRNGQYVLTGSQHFEVLRGVRESLAGRAGLLDLYTMTRRERDGAGGVPLLEHVLAARDGGDLAQRVSVGREATSVPARPFRGGFPGLLRFPLGAHLYPHVSWHTKRPERPIEHTVHWCTLLPAGRRWPKAG